MYFRCTVPAAAIASDQTLKIKAMGAVASETAHGEVHGTQAQRSRAAASGRSASTLPDGCPQPPHGLRGLCRKTNAETTCLFSHLATRFLQTMVPVVPGQPGRLERPRAGSQRLGRSGQGPGWRFSPRTAPLGEWGSWFWGSQQESPSPLRARAPIAAEEPRLVLSAATLLYPCKKFIQVVLT